MSIQGRLQLRSDVVLTPVDELSSEVQSSFVHTSGDVVVSRRRGRAGSVVVDAGAAAFLRELATPSRVVDAVLRVQPSDGRPALELLREVVPLVRRLLAERVLAEEDDASEVSLTLSLGERFEGHEIVALTALLDDTEVAQARLASGGFGAVKVARLGPSLTRTRELFAREAFVLSLLQGRSAPRLLERGEHDGAPYLITSWCTGAPFLVVAEELRATGDDGALLELCVRLAKVYATLHERGVLHGDVHGGNVLVEASGEPVLIDFGLAAAEGLPRIARAGVATYLEPELARAVLRREPLPPSTEAGEQYSLAALLYRALTGAGHLHFSLEPGESTRQIAQDPALAFAAHGLAAWPRLEAALHRALAKEPDARFASVRELADALAAARRSSASALRVGRSNQKRLLGLSRRILARASLRGDLYQAGFERAPRASVNLGAGGLAYALLRAASARGDGELLGLADVWIRRALREAREDPDGLGGDPDLSDEIVGATSTHHREPGLHCVHALIAAARGDHRAAREAGYAFARSLEVRDDHLDVGLGAAGAVLAACAMMEPHVGLDLRDAAAPWVRLIESAIAGTAPMQATPERPLGVTHGWAGLLIALMRFHTTTGAPLSPAVPRRLDELASWGAAHGRGLRFPRRIDRHGRASWEDCMPGFCGGSAGLVALWVEALATLQEPSFLDLATATGLHAWEHPDRRGDLCCGAAGRAYAMLELYRATGDARWLERARHLGGRAVVSVEDGCLRRDSLYRGEIGVMVLAHDLDAPSHARMPFFGRSPLH